MRERLDCAVLTTACSEQWVNQWLGAHASGRLQLQGFSQGDGTGTSDCVHTLATSAMRLRRYDACLIPVTEANLAWARTTLSNAKGVLQTPVMAVVRDLKAAALNDLHGLGLADFVRYPLCIEELRARIERLLDGRRYMVPAPKPTGLAEAGSAYAGPGSQAAQDAFCANILERSGMELEAFAIASASRCATTRESFRAAKSQVIERFERAYITAALGRHSGNIAMAARAAQKHRRAFWALMRKHEIDAAPFRGDSIPNRARDG